MPDVSHLLVSFSHLLVGQLWWWCGSNHKEVVFLSSVDLVNSRETIRAPLFGPLAYSQLPIALSGYLLVM